MTINLNLEPNANIGKVSLRWTFREFRHVNRPTAWWVWAGLITIGMAAWAVFTGNFLFALILLMGAIIFINETRRNPRHIECQLTTLGVAVGKKFWRWSELTNFWIAYHPPEVSCLYLVPKGTFIPRLTVPLGKTSPLTVRSMLKKYVSEDLTREDMPTSEELSRLLRLQ
jgi:hypothetical protein